MEVIMKEREGEIKKESYYKREGGRERKKESYSEREVEKERENLSKE